MNTALLVGVGAGIVSAALYASAWTGTVLGIFVLFFLSPMPVSIAGLGWGWGAAAVAAVVGALTVGTTGGLRSGLVYLLALGAPSAVFSYLALLNREDQDGYTQWYPVGRIVAWATAFAGLLAAGAILGIATDIESLRASLQQMLDRMLVLDGTGPGGTSMTAEQKAGFAALMTALLPWAMATTWFTVAILNLWAAAHVVMRSGRLARPWPDLSETTLPPGMALAFAGTVAASLLGDMTGLIASGFASAFVFAFMLVGLGILHRLTRGSVIRPVLLSLVYAGLMFLSPFSSLLVALIGLAEPLLRGRVPPGQPPAGPQT
jgi:hypothetical protein